MDREAGSGAVSLTILQIRIAEEYVRDAVRTIVAKCEEEIHFFSQFVERDLLRVLEATGTPSAC